MVVVQLVSVSATNTTHDADETEISSVHDENLNMGDDMDLQENQGEPPYLNIDGRLEEAPKVERFGIHVSAIFSEFGDHVKIFVGVQELEGWLLPLLIRKSNQKGDSDQSENTGQYSFHNEDRLGGQHGHTSKKKEGLASSLTHCHPLMPATPSICIRPYARIPDRAEARDPIK